MKKMNPEQERIFIFGTFNVYLGMVITIILDLLGNTKTIYLVGNFNFPFGLLSLCTAIALGVFVISILIAFDYRILQKGLQFIKIEKEKQEVINQMEN